MPDVIDAVLKDWKDLSGAFNWQSILIGNGASRAVWDAFKYPSLYEVARTAAVNNKLAADDEVLFAKLGNTRNVEAVLGALLTSRIVCDALQMDTRKLEERYESVRRALVDAVHHVHIPWTLVPKEILIAIRNALLAYDYVFSTNYDLLVYWSIMADDPGDFRDYFWSQEFDVGDVEVWNKKTKVLYLHGALHLYYSANGGTFKEHAAPFANLLASFAKRPDTVPLCITEGSAAQKSAAISRSDYLAFGMQQFGRTAGPLVVLGQGLSDVDEHLTEVLCRRDGRIIAVGIYPIDDTQIIKEKAHYRKLMPKANLIYFDSRSHPLASPALRVTPA